LAEAKRSESANETKLAEVGENEEGYMNSFDLTLAGRRQIGSHSPARGVGPGARQEP